MNTVRLGCGRAGTLFYEPEGLLLRSCLIPVGNSHNEHLLTFQLGYLGAGEITVHVALDSDGGRGNPSITSALLRGTDADDDGSYHQQIPGVWLTYAEITGTQVNHQYTVWGQPSIGGDDLRGEMVTRISGTLPLLTATTSAGVTRKPLPDEVRFQSVMDWDQADGSGAGPDCPDLWSRAMTA